MSVSEMFQPPRWDWMGHTEVYVDGTGRVLGQVVSALGGGYYAERNGQSLGKYISGDAARKAVEKAHV